MFPFIGPGFEWIPILRCCPSLVHFDKAGFPAHGCRKAFVRVASIKDLLMQKGSCKTGDPSRTPDLPVRIPLDSESINTLHLCLGELKERNISS